MKKRPATPPRLAQRLLHRCGAARRLEDIEGDLDEQFVEHVRRHGTFVAHLVYWRDVLLFVSKPYVRRPPTSTYQQAKGPIMLNNYVTIALRNLRRYKGYTFINIFGLAIGIACCLLILLFVQRERSYDRFHENADRLYRIYDDVRTSTGEIPAFSVSAYVGPEMTRSFPEIAAFTRLARPRASFVFTHEGQHYEEDHLLYADSTLFDLFDFTLRSGNPETALVAPFSIVLTETAARKYFGGDDPTGALLMTHDGRQAYTITGLLSDVPATSHLQFDGLISMATAEETGTFAFEDLLGPSLCYVLLAA